MIQACYARAASLVIILSGCVILHNTCSTNLVPELAAVPAVEEPQKPDAVPARRSAPIAVSAVAVLPGAGPEEVERSVAIPLEAILIGTPHLESLSSKSSFGVCRLYAIFQPSISYDDARIEVRDRLARFAPPAPSVSPLIVAGPDQDSLRYFLVGPRDAAGRPLYTPQDLRTLQDCILDREFRSIPGVADVSSRGGIVKLYEIHPDLDRLHRYGITLKQLADAIAKNNAHSENARGKKGLGIAQARSTGSLGDGHPFAADVLNANTPAKAADLRRAAERQRLVEIRKQTIAKIGDLSVSVEDIVDGGRLRPDENPGERGVVIGGQARAECVLSEDDDVVEGTVLLMPDNDRKSLRDVQERIRKLNATAGQLLPGVRIESYYASTASTENNLWVYGALPTSVSLAEAIHLVRQAKATLHLSPEVERVVSHVDRLENGATVQPFHQLWFFTGLKAGTAQPRSRPQLIDEIERRLVSQLPSVDWLTTTEEPLYLERVFPNTPATNLLMLVGPDLEKLESLSGEMRKRLEEISGIENVSVFHCTGQLRMAFRIDPDKCKRAGVTTADVNLLLQTAIGGNAASQIVDGSKSSDVIICLPEPLRRDESAILDIPVDTGNQNAGAAVNPTVPGREPSVDAPIGNTPRLRLRDLVSPMGRDGGVNSGNSIERSAPVVIYRKDGKRLLPIRFSVRGRPLVDVQTEAAKKIDPLLHQPYRIEWSRPTPK